MDGERGRIEAEAHNLRRLGGQDLGELRQERRHAPAARRVGPLPIEHHRSRVHFQQAATTVAHAAARAATAAGRSDGQTVAALAAATEGAALIALDATAAKASGGGVAEVHAADAGQRLLCAAAAVASQPGEMVARRHQERHRRHGRLGQGGGACPRLSRWHGGPSVEVARHDHAEIVRDLLVLIVERRDLQRVHEWPPILRVVEKLHGKIALIQKRLLQHRQRRTARAWPVHELARLAEHLLGVEAAGAAPRFVDMDDAKGFIWLGDDPCLRRGLQRPLDCARQGAQRLAAAHGAADEGARRVEVAREGELTFLRFGLFSGSFVIILDFET